MDMRYKTEGYPINGYDYSDYATQHALSELETITKEWEADTMDSGIIFIERKQEVLARLAKIIYFNGGQRKFTSCGKRYVMVDTRSGNTGIEVAVIL
jgi:hypothetical protein